MSIPTPKTTASPINQYDCSNWMNNESIEWIQNEETKWTSNTDEDHKLYANYDDDTTLENGIQW